MTRDTVSIVVFLHEGGVGIKRIATLRTEEMPNMPFSAGCDDHLSFDRRLAAFAARAEELVEIEVAVKSQFTFNIIVRDAVSFEAFHSFVLGLGVEGNTLKRCGAMVTGEAFWMEACLERGSGRPCT